MFNQTQAYEAPYLAAGTNALPQLLAGIGAGGGNTTGTGPLNAPFTPQMYQQSPGYTFQTQQGENAVLNNATTHGLGGNALKALTQFGQQNANTDFWTAYNAYTNAQNRKFGQLQTITGSGQNAAVNLGTLGANTGANIGSNMIAAGNASAAGQVGVASATTGAIGNIANSVGTNALFYSLLNNQTQGGAQYDPLSGMPLG